MIYADNAATTKMSAFAVEVMAGLINETYGNPSSLYGFGQKAKEVLEDARAKVATAIGAEPSEIIFTSGGSEADNQAIISAAEFGARKGKKHIISTKFEHHAVLHTLNRLEKEGFEITLLDVHEDGLVRVEEVENAIREDTVLVTVMYANNEMGAIEDIARIGAMIKEINPKTYFHTDAIQAFGKLTLRPKDAKVDMLTVSSHKIHGPKGVGFMYIRDGVRLNPLIYGGGQQKDRRSGTQDVPGIAGMGLAAEMYRKEHAEIEAKMLSVKDRLIDRLEAMEGVTVNSQRGALSAPHVVSASFAGVRAEVLLHALEDKGIYVSSGSACSSNHPAISGTLQAIGVPKELLDSTLRFSFGIYNEPEEADYTADCIEELLPELRKFRRY